MKYFSKYLIPVYLSSILFSQDQFSLSFDGNDDYVNIPDNAALDLTGSYTLEAWIKVESFTWLGGIISKYHTNASNGYTLRLTDQVPYDGIGFDGKITSTGLIDTSVWYHIAAVNDGGFSHKLYLNGVEVPLSGSAHTVYANSNPVRIGSDYASRFFDGNIDEIRMWNVSRSEDQILSSINSSLSGQEDGLVAWYNFNEGSGDVVNDLSGNENHGTIYGATWSPDAPTMTTSELEFDLLSVSGATAPSWSGYPDPQRQPSNLVIPYNDANGFADDTLTFSTIFEVGPQGQGLWTGANSIEAGSDTEESVYFDLGSSKTVNEIRLYRNQSPERFPKKIQVMAGGTYGDDTGGWTELGPEFVVDVSEIPELSDGLNQYYYSLNISETSFTGQYLRLSFRGNFGAELGGNYALMQLSAVQFFGTQATGISFQPQTKEELKTAVDLWVDANDSAIAQYGDINTWDVSLINDMSMLFQDKADFNSDISSWDVSNVTHMSFMFYDDSSFNQDLSNWDVSNVTHMSNMFVGATSFNGDISSWDVSSVTNMNSMFDRSAFNGDISTWDVSNVTDMRLMFARAPSFNQDLSNWDVSNVTHMSNMFEGAPSFNQDLSNWNVSNVTHMSFMFERAASFNQDLSNWDVSNVTYMSNMFVGATSFNGDISTWDVSNVTDMSYMFSDASSFNQDLSNWDVSNVNNMEEIFGGLSLLSDINKCGIHKTWSSNSNWPYDWSSDCYSSLVVNEIHYNPSGSQGSDFDFEYIELLNPGSDDYDLSGHYFTQGFEYEFPDSTYLAPQDFLVLGITDTLQEMGIVDSVVVWTSGNLSNGGEDIEIVDSTGTVIDYVDYEDGSNDYGDWGTSHDGGGASLELTDPNLDNSLATSWQSSWIPNGTPGSINSVEPEPVVTSIHNIQFTTDFNGASSMVGNYVETSGIVTAIDTIGTRSTFVIQDSSSAWSGIYCWWAAPNNLLIGDSITVRGYVQEYNGFGDLGNPDQGMTQLSTGYVVTVHSSSNLIPAALVLALEDVSDEKYEGVLIATQGTVTETVHDDSFGEYVISSYANNSVVSVRVNDRFAVTNPDHGSNVSITGIMNQWGGSSSSPPAWRLEPVKEADVIVSDTTIVSPPANFTASGGNGWISLSWDQVPGAVFYDIWGSNDRHNLDYVGQVSSDENTFLQSGLQNNVRYYFEVYAFNILEMGSAPSRASSMPYDIGSEHYSLHFDGVDDYVEIVHNASQNIGEINGNQGTLMALIKRSYSDLPENQWQRILSKKAYFTNSGGYELEFHRNFDHYVLNAQDGSQANGEFQSMGGWDHLAVTFNDSISRVYLNGNDVTKDSVIGPVLPSVDDLWIGLYSAGDTSNTECCTFDGWIDEVALYSKALTKDQIQDVVLNGIEISDDVEAFYNFDQGNGTVVTDLSGNENHGAIYGASWSSDVAESNFSRITFSFDLRGKDVHAEGVHIAGFFNGWEPNVSEMKDEDGDGVYTFEGLFHAGEIVEYKFINGNSWDHEVDQVEDPNCGAATNYNNRTLLVPDFDLVLSPVCINQCVPCSDVPAQPNYSLSFDGQDDYVDFPDGIISDVYNFTLEAWVNVSSFQFWQRVVDFGSSAGNQMFLTTGYENTAFPRFSINNGTGPQIVESSIAIQQNTWHHIAITLSDDNVCKMYIDGVLAGENSSVTLRPNDIGDGNTTNNWIGRSQFDVDEYFHGLIDEIKIWDFDKSQLDIQNGMNLMHDGDEYGLKLYWNFNQSDDDILYNQVSNDFHGTINGPIRSLNAPNSIVSPSIFFPASSNILARYDFSGDADDLSGNENHGSVQGGVTLGIDKNGNTNSAYYFDGSDGSVINCGSGLNLANKSHTISIMAKRESDLDYGHFFSHGTASTSSGLHCRIENGSIKYGFWSNDHDVTNTYSTSTDWHQYVFVYDYDAGTRKIYVDGSLLGSVGTVSAPYQGAGDFVIGSIVSNYGSTQSWKGSLDEIIVWDVALSETDINSIGIVDSTDDNCNDYINGFTYLGSLNDHCYYVSDNQFIWQDARVNATENGGYLASITTAEENAFLTGNVSWFGFTDEITENSFLWTTGEQVDYTNWNSNEPNDSGGEDYTHLNINGTWNDAGSGTRLTYIMEIGGGEVNVSNLNWSLQLRAWQGPFNDYQNFLGVSDSASNGFDFGYDLLEQVSSSENSVSLEFAKPDGPGYSIDTKPTVGLSDTMQVWDFRVKTDFIDGDVFLDFTFDEIPDVPVILENSATGHRHHFTDGFQYIFFAQADSAYSFSLSIGDTIAPSLSIDQAFSGPSIFISDSSYMLEWATGDGYVIDNIQILLSSDGGQTYVEQFSSNNIVSSIDWTVPDLGNIKEGLFLVRARDYAGNEVERSTNHPVTIVGHDLTFGTDAGWNLWGAPISPDSDSMSANLEDDIDGYWVTYDYVQNGYASVGSLKQGGGYWLGLLENSVINIPGTPVDHSYTISLDQGWDLISNPLVLDVLVDSLIFSKSGVSKVYNDAVSDGWINTIYGYNGSGYEVSDKIEAWSGYWIAVLDSGLSMTFPIHDAPVQTQRDNENTESEGWMITFSAETENGLKDNLATLGFNQSASSGFDPIYDAFKAPLAANPDYFSLFILNSDLAHSFGSRLARDFRSEFPESGFHEWIVSLESSVGSANIAWNLHDIPDYYEVGFSIDGGTFYGDMRSASENDNISLSSGNSLIVRVGTTVLGLAAEQIPSVYALSQNYPNPFNPLTKIQYQLPEDNLVKLSIYDIMGRKIKTLVNSTEKAGYKTLIWDATNDQGSSVSAGMYIYTIEAGDFRKTKKMILLK